MTPDLIKEILSRPRAFFVDAIETDARGRLWFGAETSAEDSGFYVGADLMHPEKTGAGTGTVTALKADARGNIWVGTDARGAFRLPSGWNNTVPIGQAARLLIRLRDGSEHEATAVPTGDGSFTGPRRITDCRRRSG